MGRFHIKHPDYWLVLRNQKTPPGLWNGSCWQGWLLLRWGCVLGLPWSPPSPNICLTWGHVILITKASVSSNKCFFFSIWLSPLRHFTPGSMHPQFFKTSLLAERDLHWPRSYKFKRGSPDCYRAHQQGVPSKARTVHSSQTGRPCQMENSAALLLCRLQLNLRWNLQATVKSSPTCEKWLSSQGGNAR